AHTPPSSCRRTDRIEFGGKVARKSYGVQKEHRLIAGADRWFANAEHTGARFALTAAPGYGSGVGLGGEPGMRRDITVDMAGQHFGAIDEEMVGARDLAEID